MRTSEWIQIGFALVLALAAWVQALSRHPMPVRRRWNITLLAIVPIAAVTLARSTAIFLPPLYVSILRDWLTVALFLVPYWQTGQFFQGPNHRIEERLLAFDHWLMPRAAGTSGTSRTGLGLVLELAYLFCYPLVPLGLLALYVAGQRDHVSSFWLVVLVATYLCYAITPFVPAYPPRDFAGSQPPAAQTGKARVFNRWILKHGSIHAISFPSAHVASTFAVSLVLLRFTPLFGGIFLFISVWISHGAVIGRYHYALDVLLGAVTALAVFLACYRFLI
jgi:membrane-associated phospholipid phosphatase